MVSTLIGLFLTMAVSALGAADEVEKLCPPDAVSKVGNKYFRVLNDTCFLFMTYDIVPFEKARKKCQDNKGTLAMPKTKMINDFLLKEMGTFMNTGPMWIGMHDIEVEGKWVWEDGSVVEPWDDSMNWFNGGLFGKGEDCMALDSKDKKWHDYRCFVDGFLPSVGLFKDAILPFICQYSTGSDQSSKSKGGQDGGDGGEHETQGVVSAAGQGAQSPDGDAGQEPVGDAGSAGIGTQVEEDNCPPFDCPTLDCGMNGFKIEDGCQMCVCDE